jgi:hypothetical protein
VWVSATTGEGAAAGEGVLASAAGICGEVSA